MEKHLLLLSFALFLSQPLRPKEAQKRDVYDEIVPNKKKEKRATNNS